jgi:hypothetical protein
MARVPAGTRPERGTRQGQITRVLPAATAFQTVRTATKLGFDVSDVLTIVASAATLSVCRGQECTLRDNPDLTWPAPDWEAHLADQ